jgi:hypothetical protein
MPAQPRQRNAPIRPAIPRRHGHNLYRHPRPLRNQLGIIPQQSNNPSANGPEASDANA